MIQGTEYFNLKYSLSGSVESCSSCRLKETHEGKYFELKYLCVIHLEPEPFICMSSQQSRVNPRPMSKISGKTTIKSEKKTKKSSKVTFILVIYNDFGSIKWQYKCL